MYEFLKFILIDPFLERDLLSYVAGTLMWVLVFTCASILVYACTKLADSNFLPLYQEKGTITKKYYIAPSTAIYYIQIGSVLTPHTISHEEKYKLLVQIGDKTDALSVDKSFWEICQVGRTLKCNYSRGRFSKALYIKSYYKK